MIAASRDPARRGEAISRLRSATLWAATWPTDPSALRTLTSPDGVTALPLFSAEHALHAAAARYGLSGFEGRVPHRPLHISEAVQFARRAQVQLLVIDMGAAHALSLDAGEMELVSAAPSKRPSVPHGPLVRGTSRPPAGPVQVARVQQQGSGEQRRPSDPGAPAHSVHRPSSIQPRPAQHSVSATFGAAATATMEPVSEAVSEELIESLVQVLRSYPEVEWASLVSASRSDHKSELSVALRLDAQFRVNLPEISSKLREVSAQHGPPCGTLDLETPEQAKLARDVGTPVYPWRKS